MPRELPNEMVDAILQALVDILEGKSDNLPAAFLVYTEEMKKLMTLRERLRRSVKDPDRPRMQPERIIDVLTHVWTESKMLTQHNMDQITDALELYEQQAEAEEASSRPEWINCY